MPATLQTSHSLLVATGQCPSIVRVKNIQSIVQGPSDAWGRPNRPQPVSVSVTVHLDKAFGLTSTSDALASDTIHYGLLSKAVLATLTRLDAHKTSRQALPLPDILNAIWVDLTGLDICGLPVYVDVDVEERTPFLQLVFLKSLQVTVHLPKASLQGGGVSLTGTGVFKNSVLIARGVALKLHDMRVPVLIGVNDNEREAKQGVVANIEVERFDEAGDSYCDLEKVVAKVRNVVHVNFCSGSLDFFCRCGGLGLTASPGNGRFIIRDD